MKKNKILSLIMAIEAIYIPFSVFTGITNLVLLFDIGTVFGQSVIVAIAFINMTLLISSYTVSYVFAAAKSLPDQTINFFTFLPAIHFVATLQSYYFYSLISYYLLP